MAGRACRFCADRTEHVVPTTRVMHTDVGPVMLTLCPGCDRRRCTSCKQPELTGLALRCPTCGADLRLPA